MANLKVPSLQHLSRNWRSNPIVIRNALVRLAKNPPIFNYNPLFGAVTDLLALKVPYDQVVEGIERGVNREWLRKEFLGILPLINDYFSQVSPDFVQSVDRRYYPVARGLMVPFEPPLMYGVGGRFHFPWLSFWRSNPLEAERLSLFVTLVDEMLLQDPDLEDAKFEILDFSAPAPSEARNLQVVDASKIPRLSKERKTEMLEIFAEGYVKAVEELARSSSNTAQDKDSDVVHLDPNQAELFD